MPEETIGNWTQSTLVKFFKDFQDQQPLQFIGKLRVDQLQVDTLLNLKPAAITLLTENDATLIGGQGAPPFENGWVNYDSGWPPAAYWKDPFGFVHLRGLVKNGTLGVPMFTLPPGYRPAFSSHQIVASNSSWGMCHVLSSGVIQFSVGSNTWVDLASIRFRTLP